MRRWRPISDAPSEEDVLVYDSRYGIVVAQYLIGVWVISASMDLWSSRLLEPTHWMPLPEPPTYYSPESQEDDGEMD